MSGSNGAFCSTLLLVLSCLLCRGQHDDDPWRRGQDGHGQGGGGQGVWDVVKTHPELEEVTDTREKERDRKNVVHKKIGGHERLLEK